jgi:hypothetical protein
MLYRKFDKGIIKERAQGIGQGAQSKGQRAKSKEPLSAAGAFYEIRVIGFHVKAG